MHIVRSERPDVIHAFDVYACWFGRMAARRIGCSLLLTICGGPNPEGRFPRAFVPQVSRLVLFSEENERFFRAQRRYSRTRLWRIPNRVNEVDTDEAKVRQVRDRLDPARSTVLRVGRFSEFHEATARQCIRLVKSLADEGLPVQLALLGVVQSELVRDALARELGAHGVIVTDPELVRMGSLVLDAGDLIVGTGRGLMEAAARGRVLMVPVHQADSPALVTEANWESLARANFSGRAVPDGWDDAGNRAAIVRALVEVDYRRKLQRFSRLLFERQFSLPAAMPQYLEIYRDPSRDVRQSLLDLAKHWFFLVMRTRRWLASPAAKRPPGI